jgi:hypothetical protein
LDAVETVAVEMARLLGWDETERQRQVTEYRELAALGQRFRTQASEPRVALTVKDNHVRTVSK